MSPPWRPVSRYLAEENRLVVAFIEDSVLLGHFELELMHHTERHFGVNLGTVVHVAYLSVEPHVRGQQPALIRDMVCQMFRHAITLGEHAVAVAIDPAADAVGIQRAMAKPVATDWLRPGMGRDRLLCNVR